MKRGILVDRDSFREAISALTQEGRKRILITGLPCTGCSLATLLLLEPHLRVTSLDGYGTWDQDRWRISWGSVPQTFGWAGRCDNTEGFRTVAKPDDWALMYLAPSYSDWQARLRSSLAAIPSSSPRFAQLQGFAKLDQDHSTAVALKHFDRTAMLTGITRLGLVSMSQDAILRSVDSSLNVTT